MRMRMRRKVDTPTGWGSAGKQQRKVAQKAVEAKQLRGKDEITSGHQNTGVLVVENGTTHEMHKYK